MSLKILNVDRNSPLSKIESEFKGSFGKIYSFNFLDQNVAVKTYEININIGNSFEKIVRKAIKEYCITKVCDFLGCGPSVENFFGFNLIFFNNQVLFAMENCEPLS